MAEDSQVTIIGPDTSIKGEMSFDRSCRLLGQFEGTITAKGQLHIAEGASCKAQVEAANVVVDGNVEGNVTAKEKIQLNAKARVNGDVVAAKLEVAEGASFSGHVSVGIESGSRGGGGGSSSSSGASAGGDGASAKEQAQPRKAAATSSK